VRPDGEQAESLFHPHPASAAPEVPAMNSLFARVRQARTLPFTIVVLAMATKLHAQNTHRAAFVRASSQCFSAGDSHS